MKSKKKLMIGMRIMSFIRVIDSAHETGAQIFRS